MDISRKGFKIQLPKLFHFHINLVCDSYGCALSSRQIRRYPQNVERSEHYNGHSQGKLHQIPLFHRYCWGGPCLKPKKINDLNQMERDTNGIHLPPSGFLLMVGHWRHGFGILWHDASGNHPHMIGKMIKLLRDAQTIVAFLEMDSSENPSIQSECLF